MIYLGKSKLPKCAMIDWLQTPIDLWHRLMDAAKKWSKERQRTDLFVAGGSDLLLGLGNWLIWRKCWQWQKSEVSKMIYFGVAKLLQQFIEDILIMFKKPIDWKNKMDDCGHQYDWFFRNYQLKTYWLLESNWFIGNWKTDGLG